MCAGDPADLIGQSIDVALEAAWRRSGQGQSIIWPLGAVDRLSSADPAGDGNGHVEASRGEMRDDGACLRSAVRF